MKYCDCTSFCFIFFYIIPHKATIIWFFEWQVQKDVRIGQHIRGKLLKYKYLKLGDMLSLIMTCSHSKLKDMCIFINLISKSIPLHVSPRYGPAYIQQINWLLPDLIISGKVKTIPKTQPRIALMFYLD